MAIRPLTGETLYSGNGAVVAGSKGAIGRAGTGFKSSWNGNIFSPPPSTGCILYYPGHPGTGTTITDLSSTLLDVGSTASDRAGEAGATYTYIDLANAADYTGYINDIQIWAKTNMTGLRVGTFYLSSGTTYVCRDSVAIGTVTAGSAVTVGNLRLRVVAGDLIGCYFATGGIEWDELGGSGIKAVSGDKTAIGTSTDFGATAAGDAISLYATGVGSYGNNGSITGATWVRLPSGLWVLNFDGTDDYLENNTADFRIGDSQGAIEMWFQTSTSAYQVLFSSDDTATTTSKVLLQVTAAADGNTGNVRVIQQNANDEADVVRGGTAVIDGKWRHVVLNSSGTAYSILLNGVAESLTVQGGANTGDWFADTTLRDNFGFGIENHTGLVLDYTGQLALMRIYSQPLSVSTASQHYQSERYLFNV